MSGDCGHLHTVARQRVISTLLFMVFRNFSAPSSVPSDLRTSFEGMANCLCHPLGSSLQCGQFSVFQLRSCVLQRLSHSLSFNCGHECCKRQCNPSLSRTSIDVKFCIFEFLHASSTHPNNSLKRAAVRIRMDLLLI